MFPQLLEKNSEFFRMHEELGTGPGFTILDKVDTESI